MLELERIESKVCSYENRSNKKQLVTSKVVFWTLHIFSFQWLNAFNNIGKNVNLGYKNNF